MEREQYVTFMKELLINNPEVASPLPVAYEYFKIMNKSGVNMDYGTFINSFNLWEMKLIDMMMERMMDGVVDGVNLHNNYFPLLEEVRLKKARHHFDTLFDVKYIYSEENPNQLIDIQ